MNLYLKNAYLHIQINIGKYNDLLNFFLFSVDTLIPTLNVIQQKIKFILLLNYNSNSKVE